MHVGAGDAAAVGRQDQGAVHLGQLRQALWAERGVEQEAARADVEHGGAVAHHDQATHAGLEDAIDAVAQGPAGRHLGQAGPKFCWITGGHGRGGYRNPPQEPG